MFHCDEESSHSFRDEAKQPELACDPWVKQKDQKERRSVAEVDSSGANAIGQGQTSVPGCPKKEMSTCGVRRDTPHTSHRNTLDMQPSFTPWGAGI